MLCSVCAKPLPGRALNCPDCGGAPAQWEPACVFQVVPGGQPYVSPEGLVFTTDGKCRWVGMAQAALLPRLLSLLLPRFNPSGPCVLYTMDETSITAQPVKGTGDIDRVFRLISKWTGGQSHPSLHFDKAVTLQLRFLTEVVCDTDNTCVHLDGGQGSLTIYAQGNQLDAIYTLLSRQQQLLTQKA